MSHEPSTESAQNQPADTAWVLSEITSPWITAKYQVNDQPFVRLQWAVSADGKTASYKDDAVGLLRSLPENARLKISVFDTQGLGQEATFQLTGLDSVRKKIGLACKWPSDSKQNFIGAAMNQLGGAVGKFVKAGRSSSPSPEVPSTNDARRNDDSLRHYSDGLTLLLLHAFLGVAACRKLDNWKNNY